jgi:hypothetical protein
MARPSPAEYAPYYESYVSQVAETEILPALAIQRKELVPFIEGIPEAAAGIPHPPYTWTIKQVIGHLIDSERVFAYRALRFGRGDETPLPGFDEQFFARTSPAGWMSLASLAEEFESVRKSNECLFGSFSEEAWSRGGEANGVNVSVRALAYILVGHVRHHAGIVRKRLST